MKGGGIKMENLEFNKKYTVRDLMNNGELITIELKPTKSFDDAVIVVDYFFHETYYMHFDELFDIFEFIN